MRVLLVDDDPDIRLIAGVSLRAHDRRIDVVEAACGAEALALVAREEIDVVLLDLSLPDQTGEEVLRQLRATPRGRALPVILLTARTAPAVDESLGIAGVIPKPFDPATLFAELRRLAGH